MQEDEQLQIEWADQTVVGALEPFVQEILSVLADLLRQPGIRAAGVSDLTAVGDFLPALPTGQTTCIPDMPEVTVLVTTRDTPANAAVLAEAAQRLGVSVGPDDYLYEVAIRLRDRL